MRKVVEFLSVVVVNIILFKANMLLIKLDTPEILLWTIMIIYLVFLGLSIVWLFSSDKVRETLLSPRKIIIQLKKNKTSVLLFIGVIVGVYPLGYYLMSWLLYSLSSVIGCTLRESPSSIAKKSWLFGIFADV